MKVIARNRRATYDYDIQKRITAGIALLGHEVKSIRGGQVSLKGSFVHLRGNEAYLVNAHIRRYSQAANTPDYEPTRARKLLLKRGEIDELAAEKRGSGMAIIPIAIGLERGLIKLEVGLGRGKRHYDKREAARKRAAERDASLDKKVRKVT